MRAAATLAAATLLLGACVSASRGPHAATRGEKLGLAIAGWAERQVGRPYRFGGSSPSDGFDCSGLAWWSHRQAGLDIPETAEAQFQGGRIVSKDRLKPGDLVFFSVERRGPSHVGVYQGRDVFVHAPKTGRTVSPERLANAYWRARYLGARRYW